MKVPQILVPILIVILTAAGLSATRFIMIPSITKTFDKAEQIPLERTVTAKFIIEGMKCVSTAEMAASTLEDLKGIKSLNAYASYNRLEVSFDPSIAKEADIVEALEGPVFDEESMEILFKQFKVVEIDGKPLDN